MATIEDVVEEARSHLMGNQRDRRTTLSSGMTDVATSATLTTDVGVTTGTRLSIGLEDMYVSGGTSVSPVVNRAEWGSPPLAHSANDTVLVNAIFSNWQIFREINNTLSDLSARGLFQVAAETFTFNPSVMGYDLTAPDFQSIYSVRQDAPGPENHWPALSVQDYDWDIINPDDPPPSALGVRLTIRKGYAGRDTQVRYRKGFTKLSSANYTADISSTGLHVEAYDLLALGAALNLAVPREVRRSFTERQGEPRRASEVPVTAALQSYRGILARYEDRISVEVSRLYQRYPETVY